MEQNWMSEYKAMNLNIPKEVTRAALPSRIKVGTHSMPNSVWDVNGAATDACEVIAVT